MKKFVPSFKDERDKIAGVATIILSMFLCFIPALIVVLFLKEQVSEGTYEIAKAFFNFELRLFLISLIFFIPVIGWVLGFIGGPIIMIFNIVICIINLCAVAKNSEIKVPVPYEFV